MSVKAAFGPWVAALSLTGCLGCHPGPSAAIPPSSISVPPGCEQRFEGRWIHALDSNYSYQAFDDGQSLVLVQLSPAPATVSVPDSGTAQPAEIRLERTDQGFAGEVHAQAMVTDRLCEVSFPAEVVKCTRDELRLRATPSRSLDATCQVAPMTPAPWLEQVLKRAPVEKPKE